MAYYNVCPDCGAYLDPGEPCDCKDRVEEKPMRNVLHMEVERRTGQLKMNLRREDEEVVIV